MTITEHSERAALDADVLAWIGESPWRNDEERFDALARRLFAQQFQHCPPYARFARGRNITPETVGSWREIPAVPTGAFKEMVLRSFPESETKKIFRTSGTSGTKRGELHLDTLALYEASLLASLRTLLLPDRKPGDTTIRVLAPSAEETPDSSLSHMFSVLLSDFGSTESGFDVVGGQLRQDELAARLQAMSRAGEPVVLCGTAFAFVHFLDHLERKGLRIACREGSRVMETGGFKGFSRVVPQAELHEALSIRLGISPSHVVNQYGMTELGSQFYDSVLVDRKGPRRKSVPPWVRVRLIDPETSQEAAPGDLGMISVYDLANTGSIAAIQTADLGRWMPGTEDGFEVVGRQEGAEARGCSIAADEMLAHRGDD
ncbi:MAG: hypothetical protein VCC04_00180 [Myxococcota bacterium]